MTIFRKSHSDNRYELVRLLYYLKLCYGRVSHLLSKLQSRITSIEVKLNNVNDLKVRESLIRELETVRNLTTSLTKLSALLEILIVKVETFSIVGASLKDLLVIKAVIKDLRSYTSSIPELSIIVEDMEDKVNDLIHSTRGEYFSSNINDMVVSEEARKIIEEANSIAALKLSSIKT